MSAARCSRESPRNANGRHIENKDYAIDVLISTVPLGVRRASNGEHARELLWRPSPKEVYRLVIAIVMPVWIIKIRRTTRSRAKCPDTGANQMRCAADCHREPFTLRWARISAERSGAPNGDSIRILSGKDPTYSIVVHDALRHDDDDDDGDADDDGHRSLCLRWREIEHCRKSCKRNGAVAERGKIAMDGRNGRHCLGDVTINIRQF